MRKLISKISVGLIFLMFGFVIITQLNTIDKQNVGVAKKDDTSPEILVENEQLKKEKEELQKKIEELSKKAEEYENAAVSNTESEKVAEELKKTRLRAGLTDVEGPGLVIYINPKTSIYNTKPQAYSVRDLDLLNLVNELYAAGAEAISINDIRLTGNGGIRTAATTNIYVNNERISAQSQIVVKAIGDRTVLESTMKFAGVITDELNANCDVIYEGKDSIVINKSNSVIEFQHIKEVKDK